MFDSKDFDFIFEFGLLITVYPLYLLGYAIVIAVKWCADNRFYCSPVLRILYANNVSGYCYYFLISLLYFIRAN